MKPRAMVASVGARTSVGLNALQTTMLFRAGAAGMAMAPLVDVDGDQVTMCLQPTLDPLMVGWERAATLAEPALKEALLPLQDRVDGRKVRFALCLDARYGSAPRASEEAAHAAALTTQVNDRAHRLLPGLALEVVARGHAAGALCLADILRSLEAREYEAAVVGGVHSDYEPSWIQQLSSQGRLFKPDNLDSFVPGELAAFVVLMREDAARRAGLTPMAGVVNVATGMERATPHNDVPAYEAIGLTSTIRTVAQPLLDSEMTAGWAITDLTFEQRRVFEWQSMLIRTRKVWSDPYAVDSPAQRLGQLGAAAVPLGMAMAAVGWQSGSGPAPIAIVYAGSEAGERGAVLLGKP